MDTRNTERIDELPVAETPEDVAVLYSWANLHGAKYRDFSASRREYRAQLRHRAAEQAREQELRAQAKAENAATFAEKAARQAEGVAMSNPAQETEYARQQALRDAEEAARVAAAERIEAARRAEAAALAEASARREQREIADANASARRQAAQYAESEVRRRQAQKRDIASDLPAPIPGEISDPYTPQSHNQSHAQPRQAASAQPVSSSPDRNAPRPLDQVYRPNEHLAAPPAPIYATPPQPAAAPLVDDTPDYHPDFERTPKPVYQPPSHATGQPPSQPANQYTDSHTDPYTDSHTDQYADQPDYMPHYPQSYSPAPSPTPNADPPRSAMPQAAPARPEPSFPAETAPVPLPAPQPARRPQGYRPDDASGVRQIYRGPEFETPREIASAPPARQVIPVHAQPRSQTQTQTPTQPQDQTQDRPPYTPSSLKDPSPAAQDPRVRAEDYAGANQRTWSPPQAPSSPATAGRDRASAWADGVASNVRAGAPAPQAPSSRTQPVSPSAQRPQDETAADPIPRRRRQDSPEYKQEHPSDPHLNPKSAAPGQARRREDSAPHRGPQQATVPPARRTIEESIPRSSAPEPSGPAWLYASAPQLASPVPPAPQPAQSSVADTLQHSRERVAARWYALKGVFEQPGQQQAEPAPVRQKETRTPILAVFSMAGGVGKTSLVATLGRSLSLLGEKVLLTDTTSHGLLPFYFGASELRQGTVRTFSPPSGSTDAPIYLVSYDVEDRSSDEAAQEALVDEITSSSRGTHRVLLDLTVSSGWIVRRMARLSPTILVPVAPDMNSIISLQSVEKFFNGIVDPEGRPLKLFYLLNQFDVSLPLHLDVREVLRRQLGDRLLPFVIRRAPAVSEALAEGMTIVDYAPEAPVAEDYLNAATWLRTVAAPATAGFRNVRWSER